MPLLQVGNITKRFPGVLALRDVDLALHRGEVLAVIGENGAGKSTLMKILAGVQPPDSGDIRLDGQPVRIDSPRAAIDLGISLIHQELNLCDNLSAGANIFLGREPRRHGLIDRDAIHQQSLQALQRVGLDISPDTLIGSLPIGRRQLVEIARALSTDARILIMDEPTSSLTGEEAETLFAVIRELRTNGVSVIYISHRLGEVQGLADRVLVLRDGENAGELSGDTGPITHDHMVSLMVGRDVTQFYARQAHTVGDPVLEVEDLIVPTWPQHRLNFSVRSGEIVGVAGLVGAGRTELLHSLFGIAPPLSGSIRVDNQPATPASPIDAIRAGIALVPEDRQQQGLILEISLRHNIGLPGLRRHRQTLGFADRRRERDDADRMIPRLDIRTPGPDQIVQYLSGGNQQKVVLGKWLALEPCVLLLDEPTRGIDVGAKEEIYRLMEELAASGVAILFVSSEMEEILGMSDRTLVMHEGRITGQLERADLSEETIMRLATGKAA